MLNNMAPVRNTGYVCSLMLTHEQSSTRLKLCVNETAHLVPLCRNAPTWVSQLRFVLLSKQESYRWFDNSFLFLVLRNIKTVCTVMCTEYANRTVCKCTCTHEEHRKHKSARIPSKQPCHCPATHVQRTSNQIP